MSTTPLTPESPEQGPQSPKFNWLVFLAVIFVPTLATAAVAAANLKTLAVVFAIGGGGLSAAVTATLLARRFLKSHTARAGFGIILFGVFTVAFVTMNCFGCLASGYKFNMR